MKFLASLAAAGVMMLCALLPATPKTVTVKGDPGGIVVQYVRKYSEMRDRCDRLVIDGSCDSACTIFLGLMSPAKYCVTSKANLGFHSASLRTGEPGNYKFAHAPEMSALMFALYPKRIKRLLKERGWNGDDRFTAHPDLITLNSKDLAGIVPSCGSEQANAN